MADSVADTTSVKQSKAPLYVSIAILAALVLSYFLIPDFQDFLNNTWQVLTSDNESRIKNWVDQFGIFGPVAIVLSMILQMFLLVIPTPLLMVVSVLAYGPLWGSLIILVAVFCASTTGYLIGAYLGPPVVKKLLGGKSEKKIESFIKDYGFWAVVVTRISPFLSNDAISFVGGILRMGYWRFIGATLLGITPLTVFIAYLGENSKRLRSGLLWGSVASIVLFVLYVWWDKRRQKNKS
ncbi:TVP38/TMEM64 family protein [Fulvivirga ulvae]|uniref:TVP38/TMEM64 family protein n=1 Tax=Fulvivirga ulvae TaxID=2904245 RepID=UPI001F2ED84A|nr:TVP38/TMEM64 family protein [Fulvivirga ulvae]UII31139.1 TVP38/TMEM64 family protein [Fulvivirga ulvae]